MFSLRYRHNTSDPAIQTISKEPEKTCDKKDEEKASESFISTSRLRPSHHVFLVFIAAWIVRYWHSGSPHFITQSELILAQQINWTLKGQFHIGSTPPLATLMYSFFAYLNGYHGTEDILYAGQTLDELPLATLRQITILISSLTIPVIYSLMRILASSHTTALFTCGLFAFETGMVVQSRFIAPNPLFTLLLLLATCSFFSTPPLSKFRRQCLTGVLLGCALCTQWHAGSLIVFFLVVSGYEFWKNLGDPTQSLKQVPRWISIPCFTLVILPFSVYIALFQWHFHLVPNAGDHDFFLSSPLRYSLIGNTFEPIQQYIAYGSHVVLKHISSNNGYLHSDDKIFEGGSNQNQVTVYPYEDMNNIWVIQKLDGKTYTGKEPEYLYNNNAFKLEHYASTRKLHSHDHKAPVHTGEGFYEVTSYGNPTVTEDGNDVWWIRTVTEDEGFNTKNFDPINALTTRFRLLHHQGCYLASHYDPLTLVEGGAQQEVSCMNSAKTTVSSWVFEYAHHPDLQEISPMVEYGSPTIKKKLVQVHDLMRNYKKVVYDRLSSVPPDETEPTDTMMYSGHEPHPFLWLKTIYAYLIWDDLTGRSAYVVLHPLLRILTLLVLGLLPLVALFSTFTHQMHWVRSSAWCQQFWSNRHIQTATFMLSGVLIHTIGLQVTPAHTVTLSDMHPALLFGVISFAELFEGSGFRRRRPVLVLILFVCIVSFFRWSRGIDGSSTWQSHECKLYHIKNIDCEKYPLETPDFNTKDHHHPVSMMDPQLLDGEPQEDFENTLESRHIQMPGTPLRFEYDRGQEVRAEIEIAKVRSDAYRQAANEFLEPAHRFVRAVKTKGPTLDQVTRFRQDMHQHVLEKQLQDAAQELEPVKEQPVQAKKERRQVGGRKKKKHAGSLKKIARVKQ